MSGFGLGLLVSQGFFDAKAPLDPLCNHPKLCSFGLLLKMRCIFFTEQPYTDQGAPLDPLCNHPKLCSFAPAPKNAAHFLYGEALHRPGGTPGPPYAVPSLFEIGVLISEFSVS